MKLEEVDNGLYRTVYNVYRYPLQWLCSGNSLEYHKTRSLEKYVNSHQGAFNQQLSTVDITLVSTLQVTTFAQELKDSYCIFGITLRLIWHVLMAEVQIYFVRLLRVEQ